MEGSKSDIPKDVLSLLLPAVLLLPHGSSDVFPELLPGTKIIMIMCTAT